MINDIKIRKLLPEDIDIVAQFVIGIYQSEGIWLTYTIEDMKEELYASFSNLLYKPVFFLAFIDSELIGIASYMITHMSSQAYELSFVTIDPKYQRKGIGQLLTKIRLQEILSLDKDAIIFTMARRPKLLEKFNFKIISNYIDSGGTEVFYMFCMGHEIIIF